MRVRFRPLAQWEAQSCFPVGPLGTEGKEWVPFTFCWWILRPEAACTARVAWTVGVDVATAVKPHCKLQLRRPPRLFLLIAHDKPEDGATDGLKVRVLKQSE